jgi:hypothetical protein
MAIPNPPSMGPAIPVSTKALLVKVSPEWGSLSAIGEHYYQYRAPCQTWWVDEDAQESYACQEIYIGGLFKHCKIGPYWQPPCCK